MTAYPSIVSSSVSGGLHEMVIVPMMVTDRDRSRGVTIGGGGEVGGGVGGEGDGEDDIAEDGNEEEGGVEGEVGVEEGWIREDEGRRCFEEDGATI